MGLSVKQHMEHDSHVSHVSHVYSETTRKSRLGPSCSLGPFRRRCQKQGLLSQDDKLGGNLFWT